MTQERYTFGGYNAGHPWFYFLGGPVLSPKQIQESVRITGYGGYMADDIGQADRKSEPRRSTELRALRDEVRRMLSADISRYREVARELHRYRRDVPTENPARSCADVHTAMSLKHNHIFNHFAHLQSLDEALSKQRDLFDM